MKTVKIEQSNRDFNAVGGLSLVGALLYKHRYTESFYSEAFGKTRTADYLNAYIGLVCTGHVEYEAIDRYRNNRPFSKILGLRKITSAESLRQNLDSLAKSPTTFDAVSELQNTILQSVGFSPIQCDLGDYIPLDVDVTPFDNSGSKKEGVSCTYKMHDGYAPIMAYLGTEGFLAGCELREGKQHCQKETPEFLRTTLKRAFSLIPLGKRILLRMDGGNDALANRKVIDEFKECYAIVKRNSRHEKKEEWLYRAQTLGTLVSDNGFSRHYRGFVTNFVANASSDDVPGDVVFDIYETYAEENGQMRSIPKISVDTYWTNLPESPETIIALYHDHATSEQFHSEIKSDLDAERLPSGKFATNKLILQLIAVAYNILRRISSDIVSYCGAKIKRKKVKRRRIRTVLLDVVYTAFQWIEKGGRWIARFGRDCPLYTGLCALYAAYSR
jgi:hypothetical protein